MRELTNRIHKMQFYHLASKNKRVIKATVIFGQMCEKHGILTACSRLIETDPVQSGFFACLDASQETVEHIVADNPGGVFNEEQKTTAQWRLNNEAELRLLWR